jgi:hypothetical protein
LWWQFYRKFRRNDKRYLEQWALKLANIKRYERQKWVIKRFLSIFLK